jgi:hypothetical protein
MKKTLLILLLISSLSDIYAQNHACNKLGAWIWTIEATTCKTHAELADSLAKVGIKRIYVKVIDGRAFTKWSELDDTTLVKTYKKKGLEVWGWSYNYPNNEDAQAEAIYRAAKTGYEGYILDVEAEFDNDSLALYKLFFAFDKRKKDAIAKGFAKKGYEMRVTTWGNPIQHKFNIKAMNPFVSAYMPQTYVEQWGTTYITNMEKWITQGETDYKKLGATKPIYHIVANEKTLGTTGALTATDINRFITKAGGETSLWRVPGGDINAKNWATFNKINWKKDFCKPSSANELADIEGVMLFPNPTNDIFQITTEDNLPTEIRIVDINGRLIFESSFTTQISIESATWATGMYICQLRQAESAKIIRIVKQ